MTKHYCRYSRNFDDLSVIGHFASSAFENFEGFESCQSLHICNNLNMQFLATFW